MCEYVHTIVLLHTLPPRSGHEGVFEQPSEAQFEDQLRGNTLRG